MMNKFSIFLGGVMILFILYNRLWRIRLPRELLPPVLEFHLYLYILLMIFSFSMIMLNLYSMFKIITRQKAESTLNIFLSKFLEHPNNPVVILGKSFRDFDYFIKDQTSMYNARMNYSTFILKHLGNFFSKYSKTALVILYMTKILPQSFVLYSFIYDAFITHKFSYFYDSLWLLIIPLMANYILYSVKTFMDDNLEYLNELLEAYVIQRKLYNTVTTINDFTKIDLYYWQNILNDNKDEEYLCFHQFNPEMQDHYPVDKVSKQNLLQLCLNNKDELFLLRSFFDRKDSLKVYLEIPFNILRYLFYFIGWFIICYTILF